MTTLYVLFGIPGSGKSYWARQQYSSAAYVCPDDIREEMFGFREQRKNHKVFAEGYRRTEDWLKNGHDVVFDATSLTRREEFFKIPASKRVLVVMRTSHAVSFARNAERPDATQVPQHVMLRMVENYEKALCQITREGWDEIHFVYGNQP